jgi:two-component system, chemotaxis family, chemotaxis protein CheY
MTARFDKISVLILDDHYFMRTIWKTIFVGLGVTRFLEAEGAAEGFEVLQSNPCDLVIADYHLGDLTGAEFTKLLRSSPDTPNAFIPIIGCTADARPSVVAAFVEAGADEVLAKPVSARVAWAKVHATIERRRPFVRAPTYFGPDRRRRSDPKYIGPERRVTQAASLAPADIRF